MIESRIFGQTKDGRDVTAFTFRDGASSATVLDLGGAVQSLVVPDRNGTPTDVVLGYRDVASYENNGGCLGQLVGRFANRIGGGKLELDGKTYQLYRNDGVNHRHGGREGFQKKLWEHSVSGDSLTLSLLSPDGEENYPGTLRVSVTYTFRGGELRIDYAAETDKTTAVNLTNHTYFNLSGEETGSILDQLLFLDSDKIARSDERLLPTGGFRPVKGTPFDFTSPKPLGRDIGAEDEDLRHGNGYDHCFRLKNECGQFVWYAVAESPKTGIRMECGTDMPAVQLYTGNGLHFAGKGAYYGPRAGFCLETQLIPNNMQVPEYAAAGSSVLAPGVRYAFTAVYRFGV